MKKKKMAGQALFSTLALMGSFLTVSFLPNLNIASPGSSSKRSETRTTWMDLHYHWEDKSNLDETIRVSQEQGIKLGVTGEGGDNWGLKNDKSLQEFLKKLQGKPVYKGLQVYGLGWEKRYSHQVLAQLDYVAADALMFPDRNGRTLALWGEKVTFPDPQDFMDRYVEYNVKILNQPINIWSNPTYLPVSLQTQYRQLWTKARMQRVIQAAARNHIAIELNSKYNIPSKEFILSARKAGCRFSMGSNRHDDEPGNLDYAIRMYKECGLKSQDMYRPAGIAAGIKSNH